MMDVTPKFNSRYWWAALFTTLLGIGISLYLTIIHFKVIQVGFTGRSICNLSTYLNCDIVLASRYSTIGIIPIGGIGVIFYIYLLGALLFGRLFKQEIIQTLYLPLFGTIFSCLVSIMLAYISLFVLNTFCLFCSLLYLINILLLLFIKGTLNHTWKKLMGAYREVRWGKPLLYFFACFSIGGLLLYAAHKSYAKELTDAAVDRYVRAVFNLPAHPIDIQDRPFWGNPQAKVVFVEFSDFECPYCKIAAFTLKPYLEQYKDKVKLVFMNYPLDKTCNKRMGWEGHKHSCLTAYGAHCAAQQGKFWEFHDEAFDAQAHLNEKTIEKIVKKLNLNQEKFQACLKDPATEAFVVEDLDRGAQLDIQGTPSVFINGHPLPEWRSKKVLHKVVEHASQNH